MGQLVDLHARLLDMLGEVKTAYEAIPDRQLRVLESPPTQRPGDLPCVFILTPDENFMRRDTMTGEATVTVTVRICMDAGHTQAMLLELADILMWVVDIWVWNDPPEPVDQAKRTAMSGVTPVFNDIPMRGADFPIVIQMLRPIHPPA